MASNKMKKRKLEDGQPTVAEGFLHDISPVKHSRINNMYFEAQIIQI